MKRALRIIVTVICLMALSVPALAASFEDATNSVVRIYIEELCTVTDLSTEEIIEHRVPTQAWIGTGFAVGKANEPVKYFVTNEHVASAPVENTQFEFVGEELHEISYKLEYQPYIIFSDLEHKVVANQVVVSDRCDLAVLSLNEPTTDRVPMKIRTFDVDSLEHEEVYAVGFPGISDHINLKTPIGTGNLNSYKTDITFTKGIVNLSKEHAISKEGELIQHDAKISGGNSGGPLVDKNGYVLGVNTSILVEDEVNGEALQTSDYGLAITANEVVRFLEDNRIEFMLAPNPMTMILLIAGGAVVLIALIIAIVLLKKNSKKNARTLFCDEGNLHGRKYPLKGKVAIGHDARRCQIVFPAGSPGVSGLHCTVTYDGKIVKVIDENSSYGTWIDNQRLQPGVATVMHRGQKLYLGSTKQALSLHN